MRHRAFAFVMMIAPLLGGCGSGDDGERILYSSTHHHDASCPAPPDMSMGYVWPIYDTYDVFSANLDGTDLRQLTETDGYDAEATVSPVGDRVVFTSVRDGDLDLYSMNLDGTDVRRLTDRLGYDGGAFYSPDGSQIIWRAHYPEEGEEADDYQRLLGEGRATWISGSWTRTARTSGRSPTSRVRTSRRTGIRTGSGSSSARTTRIRRAASSRST